MYPQKATKAVVYRLKDLAEFAVLVEYLHLRPIFDHTDMFNFVTK